MDECGDDGVDSENNEEEESQPRGKELKAAKLILEWMRSVGLDESLQCMSADSTNSNTGWKAGIIAWFEKKLGKIPDGVVRWQDRLQDRIFLAT